MKSFIACFLVLLAVACTRTGNVNDPARLADISSPSLPSRQWNTQDEIGQSSFGYSYPGQARSKRFIAGCEWNFGNRNPIVDITKFSDSDYSSTVLNVERTLRNQYPFMAALLQFDETSQRYKLVCGGSLISATKILTAAHCVIQNNTIPSFDKLVVKLGMHIFSETEDDAELTMRIRKIDIHENYDQLTKFNDIAIVTLVSPVKFTDKISTVCLPEKCNQDMEYYDKSRAVGWGNSKEGEEIYGALRHMSGTMTANNFCIDLIKSKKIELADHMTCAFPYYGGLCQNFDGGPMVLQRPFSTYGECPWIQLGIIISTNGCHEKSEPDVYTRLTSFWSWIDNNLKPL